MGTVKGADGPYLNMSRDPAWGWGRVSLLYDFFWVYFWYDLKYVLWEI